jgi:hypothetical protein
MTRTYRWMLALLLGCLLLPGAALAIDWDTADLDEDGYSKDEGDCADGNPEINPGVREDCEDGVDNDCDLAIDFDDPECTPCGACGTDTSSRTGATTAILVAGLVLLVRRLR